MRRAPCWRRASDVLVVAHRVVLPPPRAIASHPRTPRRACTAHSHAPRASRTPARRANETVAQSSSIINHQSSIINHQSSIINHQSSSIVITQRRRHHHRARATTSIQSRRWMRPTDQKRWNTLRSFLCSRERPERTLDTPTSRGYFSHTCLTHGDFSHTQHPTGDRPMTTPRPTD